MAGGVCSYQTYFVDLFVRQSNAIAIAMYRKFGYSVYRRVLGYYGGDGAEDACGVCSAHVLVA
jgi:N-terminal acetyltransferase B complex catalytic subunit